MSMKIDIQSTNELGGVEVVVDGVCNCPIEIHGSITTWPHDPPTFTVEEASFIMDDEGYTIYPDNLAYVEGKLQEAGFYDKIIDAVKQSSI